MRFSGLALVGFLVGHLLGNLLIFGGADALNSYAAGLRDYPGLLWAARVGILLIFLLHIFLGLQLSIENRRARPQKYRHSSTIQASLASRSMAITGLVMLSYVVYHLMHFTWGTVHGSYYQFQDELGRHDVYRMVVLSFQNVWITLTYVVALFLTFVHLSHGLPSLFQSTGLNKPALTQKIQRNRASIRRFAFYWLRLHTISNIHGRDPSAGPHKVAPPPALKNHCQPQQKKAQTGFKAKRAL